MKFFVFLYKIFDLIDRAFDKFFINPVKKSMLNSCGSDVRFVGNSSIAGWKNVSIGDDVFISTNCLFLTIKAKISIGNHVMFGPSVKIITGNHIVDIPGRFMTSFSDAEKRKTDDEDVVIEGDNWIGANAIILKGVTLGYGSVVAAGAVVINDVEPYSIVGGVPAKKIKMRFDNDTIKKISEGRT